MIGQIIVHAVIFFGMLFLYVTSLSLPATTIDPLGSAWWPQIVLTIGMVLTAISGFLSVRKQLSSGKKAGVKITAKEAISVGASSGVLIVTLLLIGRLGFILTIPILISGFMFLLGCRKLSSFVLASVIGSFAFTIVFGRFMEVSLPRGEGILRFLSFYLY
ncbi:MAG: tripartite tricarboxylate transporter TctB family protein [Treponema sp.]|nr:tripartite tricarboxylate transporter TctB family protein [Treponema sp.]